MSSTMIIRDIEPDPLVGNFLKGVPLFAHLDRTQREKLGGALTEKTYPQGATVFRQGDPGDEFFIIKEGKCTVSQTEPVTGKEIVLTMLSSGDHFGEQSILTDIERTASVTCDEMMTVYVLQKQTFNALFKKDRIEVTFAQRKRVAVSAEGSSFHSARKEKSPGLSDLPVAAPMSPEVKALVLHAVHNSLLFQTLEDEHKEAVARIMYEQEVPPGTRLVQIGEEADKFYIVEEGAFDVFEFDDEGQEVKVDHHRAGASFGELALMYGNAHKAAVVSVGYAKVRVLERGPFNIILKEVGEAQLERYSRWLARVELLAPLTNSERIKIAEALEVVDYDAGVAVFNQGDPGDAMYIIVSGKLTVHEAVEGATALVGGVEVPEEKELRTLRVGDYFGEKALMGDNNVRGATVRCKRACRLLKLKHDTFVTILGPLQEMFKTKQKTYGVPEGEVSDWRRGSVQREELVTLGVLGKGSYGYVTLVQDQRRDPNGPTYALKVVSKQRIVETHQKQHILDEKALMQQTNHPFLIRLIATYSDQNRLFFLMEAALGGELFPILRKMRVFPLPQARFYAAQVILAFEYLHKKEFVYRDLKPENLLLDGDGYLKLTDFGFCKKVPHKTWTMCGTPEYLAPEVITHKGHGRAVDWWTIGIFIFEMLASYTPFYGSGDDLAMYDRICSGDFKFPSHFSKSLKTLIRALLEPRPHQRLGVGKAGVEAIKNAEWFARFDWQGLLWRKLPAPMAVEVKSHTDLTNYNQSVTKLKIKPYVSDGTDWDKDF